jgi:hypothetical protein
VLATLPSSEAAALLMLLISSVLDSSGIEVSTLSAVMWDVAALEGKDLGVEVDLTGSAATDDSISVKCRVFERHLFSVLVVFLTLAYLL